jgi:hypothetical protein
VEELYGLIDTGLTYTSNSGGSSNFQQASGILNGNRWGLRLKTASICLPASSVRTVASSGGRRSSVCRATSTAPSRWVASTTAWSIISRRLL